MTVTRRKLHKGKPDPYAAYRISYEVPEWRYKDLLTALGTAKEVQALLVAKGYETVPEDTIQGWRTRNSIPGKWVPILVQMGVERKFIGGINDLKPREK